MKAPARQVDAARVLVVHPDMHVRRFEPVLPCVDDEAKTTFDYYRRHPWSLESKVSRRDTSGKTCLGSRSFIHRGPSVGVAASAGLPVLLGAGLAPRLAGNRRLAAVPALAEFPGSMQALLGIEPLVLHALRGLVSLPVVLDLILPLGFCLDRVRCGPLFRFCGPGGCFLKGFPCPSWVLPRGRASALVGRLRQGESELESMAYCPPVRAGT